MEQVSPFKFKEYTHKKWSCSPGKRTTLVLRELNCNRNGIVPLELGDVRTVELELRPVEKIMISRTSGLRTIVGYDMKGQCKSTIMEGHFWTSSRNWFESDQNVVYLLRSDPLISEPNVLIFTTVWTLYNKNGRSLGSSDIVIRRMRIKWGRIAANITTVLVGS